jgi:hypothetical protein
MPSDFSSQFDERIEKDTRSDKAKPRWNSECKAGTSQQKKGVRAANCIGAGDFIRAYRPICYTIEGVLPSGFIYGLTARRSGGKTALLIAAALAPIKGGREILGREVEQGRAAYVIKENPDDFRMKAVLPRLVDRRKQATASTAMKKS